MLRKEHSDKQLIALKQYDGGDIWTIPPPLLSGTTARSIQAVYCVATSSAGAEAARTQRVVERQA